MKKSLVYLMTFSFFCACKKDEITESPTRQLNTHLPLKVGNFWVYEGYYVRNSNDIYRNTDTLKVTGDTTINNRIYFILEGNYFPHESRKRTYQYYWRDSLDYVINSEGRIIVSTSDFDHILEQYGGMQKQNLSAWYVTRARELEASYSNNGTVYNNIINMEKQVFQIPENPHNKEVRFLHEYFAKDVGIVFKESQYLSDDELLIQSHLIDYHLE